MIILFKIANYTFKDELYSIIYTFISVCTFPQKCIYTFCLLASVTALIMYNYKSVEDQIVVLFRSEAQ